MRKTRSLTAVSLAVATIAVAGAAHAGVTSGDAAQQKEEARPYRLIEGGIKDCRKGYLCVWHGKDYTQNGVAIYGSERNWKKLPEKYRTIARHSRSFFNNGFGRPEEGRDAVRLARGEDLGGGSFVLCRGDALPYTEAARKDTKPGKGWADEVQSHQWFDAAYC